MANTKQKIDKAQVLRKTKIETTYEYVPILGEVLGFWRKINVQKFGEEVCVFLNHSLEEYDRLYINGKEVDILKVISEELTQSSQD